MLDDMNNMPTPPFPDPNKAQLQLIIDNACAALDAGADPKTVILQAAVLGWYEGHIEGEDVCPGCTYRGDLPQQQPTT